MALFNKKLCDICGGSMGLIIDNKALDGNFCHDCRHKLSPFFHGSKNATLQQIREQLAYRENNRQQLNIFSPSKVMGTSTKVYLDPQHNCFVVSKQSDYRAENADIINLQQVVGARTDVKEHKEEERYKDAEGHYQSYNPKRYKYQYEINVIINVNSPYFNEIKFEVTKDRPTNKASQEYMNAQYTADEIVAAVTGRPMPTAPATGAAGVIGNVAGVVGNLLGGQQGMNGMNNMNGMNGMNNGMSGGIGGVVGNLLGGQQQGMNNGAAGLLGGVVGNLLGGQQQGMNNLNGMNNMNGMNGMNNMNGMQQWQCPNCGSVNNGMACTYCGFQRQ